MATQLDYYGILQVHPRAEKKVIDTAYRKLAAKYHPDISQRSDAPERMKQINAAYEVVSDPVKRAAYDATWGMASSQDMPPYAETMSQYPSKVRRTLLIAAGLLLTFMALRLSLRLVLLLAVISVVVWLYLLWRNQGNE